MLGFGKYDFIRLKCRGYDDLSMLLLIYIENAPITRFITVACFLLTYLLGERSVDYTLGKQHTLIGYFCHCLTYFLYHSA